MLLRKAVFSTLFAGVVGVAAWGTWGYWHGGAVTLPLPTQAPNPTVARTAAAPKPHAVKTPQSAGGHPGRLRPGPAFVPVHH